jgi:hypothetical protein
VLAEVGSYDKSAGTIAMNYLGVDSSVPFSDSESFASLAAIAYPASS